jgi:hypothetical protein
MSAKIAVVPMSTILSNNLNLNPRVYLGLPDNEIMIRRAKILARMEADKRAMANLEKQVKDEAEFQAKWGITIQRMDT